MEHEQIEYKADQGSDYIDIKDWGKDHYSTFAYLETRAVDGQGKIDNRRMRCDNRLHRHFAHIPNGREYPTILKGGVKHKDHDDWSCLEDMVAAGVMRAFFWTGTHGRMFGGGRARIELTPLGLQLAAEIRAFKANGGNFGEFNPSDDLLAEIKVPVDVEDRIQCTSCHRVVKEPTYTDDGQYCDECLPQEPIVVEIYIKPTLEAIDAETPVDQPQTFFVCSVCGAGTEWPSRAGWLSPSICSTRCSDILGSNHAG